MREYYACDTEVNLCYSNPCANGGQCVRREGGYTCVCRPGFAGTDCQLDLKKDVCRTAATSPASPAAASSAVLSAAGGSNWQPQCGNCTGSGGGGGGGSGGFYTPMCQLRSRSFYRGSYLTFPALRQRYRLHLKLRFNFVFQRI